MNMRRIAQIAGVSSATVSRVIHGSPQVREETAQRVRRVIAELNFIPNPHATTLKYGRSMTFGVIIPDLANPFYAEFLRDLEGLLAENDQELLIANTHSDSEQMRHSVHRMLRRRVDAVALLASEFETKPFEALMRSRIPVITLDRRETAKGLSDVAVDYEQGMEDAVRWLKKLGHRRIGFLGGGGDIVTSRIRHKAFVRALRKAEIPYREEFVKAGDYRISGGELTMRQILDRSQRPTAVLTANDLTAFGALHVLRERGVRVPEEMSLIGCDDILLADIVAPPLTTLRISRSELAEVFFDVFRETDKKTSKLGRQVYVGQTLVVRESAAKAPKKR